MQELNRLIGVHAALAGLFGKNNLSFFCWLGEQDNSREKDCFQSGISLNFWAFVVPYGFSNFKL